MESISHHITSLVINNLEEDMYVHTHKYASILTSWTKGIARNQVHDGLWKVNAWFRKQGNDE